MPGCPPLHQLGPPTPEDTRPAPQLPLWLHQSPCCRSRSCPGYKDGALDRTGRAVGTHQCLLPSADSSAAHAAVWDQNWDWEQGQERCWSLQEVAPHCLAPLLQGACTDPTTLYRTTVRQSLGPAGPCLQWERTPGTSPSRCQLPGEAA